MEWLKLIPSSAKKGFSWKKYWPVAAIYLPEIVVLEVQLQKVLEKIRSLE